MTNDPYDPYRSAGAGDSWSGPGEPSAPDPMRGQPDPMRPPSESVWSRPDAEPVGPPAAAPQSTPPDAAPPAPWAPEAAPTVGSGHPTEAPSPWPPAAAQSTTGQQPPGYPPPPYQPPPYPPPGYPPPPYQTQPAGGRRTNALAVVALVCSLAGVFTGVSAPVGAILGHVALGQIRQSGEEGSQLATIAIWVGWIITGLIVAAICALVVLAVTLSRTTA